jgi:hypothetical protein
MLSVKLLVSLLSALTLASPTPGEQNPALLPAASGDPTWYCTVKNRVVLDYYMLSGRNWNTSERALKESISEHSRKITNWSYNETEKDGGREFVAHVSFFLFLLLLSSFFGLWHFLCKDYQESFTFGLVFVYSISTSFATVAAPNSHAA